MSIGAISRESIQQALTQLGYGANSVKRKILDAILSFYDGAESPSQIISIDTDELVIKIWNLDPRDQSRIRSKRRNYFSLKSSIISDFSKLASNGLNPENITISPVNTFDMTEEAKNNLLSSFTGAVEDGGLNLEQAAEVLKAISDYLGEMEPEESSKTFDIIKNIKNILNKISLQEEDDEEFEEVEEIEEDDNEIEEVEDEDGEIEEIPDEEFQEEEVEELSDDEALEDIQEIAEDEEFEEVEEIEEGDSEIEEVEDEDGEIEEIPDEEFQEEEIEELSDDEALEDFQEIAEDEEFEEIEEDDNEIEEVKDEDGEIEEIPDEEFQEEEIEELSDDEALEDFQEIAEDEEFEEIEEDDNEIEEVEDEDGEIEEIPDEEFQEEEVEELSDDEVLEDFQEIAEDEEFEEIEEDHSEIEEVEDEDSEIEEIPDEEFQEEEVEELSDDEVLEDFQEIAEDEEFEEIEEDDNEIEEVEDEDGEIEEIPDEEFQEEEIEEISDDEILDEEDIEEIDENDEIQDLTEEEQQALDAFRESRELARQFDNTLSDREKKFNVYVMVPGGLYTIGSKKKLTKSVDPEQVQMPTSYIGKYPVTNALFEIFIDQTGYVTTAEKQGFGMVYFSRFKTGKKTSSWQKTAGSRKVKGAFWYQPTGPGSSLHDKRNHPVVQVSVEDARAYASWIGRRLPTEAEWEAAACTDLGYLYPWGDTFDLAALNIQDSGIADTCAVDEHDQYANEFGICDMLGNTMEWTSDTQAPLGKTRKTLPWHIARGGGWNSPLGVTVSSRSVFASDFTANIIGFRCISEIFLE